MAKIKNDPEKEALQKRIKELEERLNECANSTGNFILKQLPNGQFELNGTPFDNTGEIEYYNSSKATYGEQTMFRLGKEAVKRDMEKLTTLHMHEVDELRREMDRLRSENESNNQTITLLQNDLYEMGRKAEDEATRANNIQSSFDKYRADISDEIQTIKNRYETVITETKAEKEKWIEKFLTINNITASGTIITKYGKVKLSESLPSDI